jgi:sialic acid synthase SpsE
LHRPGTGLAPHMFAMVLSGVAARKVQAGELLKLGDISE